jgi:hypothetical protein
LDGIARNLPFRPRATRRDYPTSKPQPRGQIAPAARHAAVRVQNSEVAKRIDIAAAAIFHHMTIDAVSDLDLSNTSPLGSPWEPSQRDLRMSEFAASADKTFPPTHPAAASRSFPELDDLRGPRS